MDDDKLIEECREVIANGFGCHRDCEHWGSHCGCREDAKKVIAKARAHDATDLAHQKANQEER